MKLKINFKLPTGAVEDHRLPRFREYCPLPSFRGIVGHHEAYVVNYLNEHAVAATQH